MRKIVIAGALAAALVMPTGASADPSPADFRNAARYCDALRDASGTQNFRNMFGGGRNAFGKCVSRTARDEAAERRSARRNAVDECRAEQAQPEADFRAAHGGQSFAEFYGRNANDRNAFGRCVSTKARENKAEADARDQNKVNAARQCRTEQRQPEADFRAAHGGQSFAEFYGRNANDRNAFGKCVSQKARAMNSGQAS